MFENLPFNELLQRIEPNIQLHRAWELTGGVSAQVTALEVLLPDGQARKMVVRQPGEADLAQNPHIAADEYKLLRLLTAAGLPAPTPYLFDESREIMPTPYVVIEYVEGETILSATAPEALDLSRQMAAVLARIHQAEVAGGEVSFLPRQTDRLAELIGRKPANAEDSDEASRIREALQPVWQRLPRNPDALLHGDYWPGNILWNNGELSAVIDWEDAAIGDPLADLANGRLEIAWMYGEEAMHHFTRVYQSHLPALDYAYLPYWDLCAALKPALSMSAWGLDPGDERRMREKLRGFVTRALEQIDY